MIATKNPTQPVRHLFVYGTLLPAFLPAEMGPVMAELQSVGPATLDGARLVDLQKYPGAVVDGTDAAIHGRVYRLPAASAAILRRLDEYEGVERPLHQSLFVRRARSVRMSDGQKLRAWVYFYNRPAPHAPTFPDGRYRKPATA